ncbi:MAG TPA: carboxypeptidase regulatory-like domain-containing protein [Pyrinomonadaceae bacterium]|jgi:hypothetical protein
MKKILTLTMFSFLFGCFVLVVEAQDIQTRGSIKGIVTDPSGAVVPGAKVTVSGATGDRAATTNSEGAFEVTNLNPGVWSVKIEQPGFKTVVAPNQTVFVGKATIVEARLEVGEATATVEVTSGSEVDQTTTAVASNLNDQLFQNVPVPRGVSGLFYLAPGATDSLGSDVSPTSRSDNPSISGGSALDNLYIADGVNITNSAFGGIGTFSRVYGALGTGINTSFVKEVQVKTGGFEPQYGQSIGGVVNIITQSGGNEFHGAVYGYARPDAFEARYKQRDDFSVNKVGRILANENYDAGVDLGGPILKDRLFFFGSFNPSFNRTIVEGSDNSGLFALLGKHVQRYRTLNYAGKIDWNIVRNHTLAFSIFGDPTKTNVSSFNSLNIDNTTAFSKLDYGSRNLSLRYNGALSSSWTLSIAYSLNKNKFDESGFADFNQIIDRTGPTSTGASRGQFNAIGLGFFEPTRGATHGFTADTTKTVTFFGSHSIGFGFQFQRGFYSGTRDRSGAKYTIPAVNAEGLSIAELFPGAAAGIGQTVNAAWSLRSASDEDPSVCPLCPVFNVPGATDIGLGPGNRRVYLRQDRGEFGNTSFETESDYHALYLQDTWRFNRFVTAIAGIRWEQERMVGNFTETGVRPHYSLTGNWAPRVGVTVDPLGKGKMKAYYNFGRFYEFLPLDIGERSLSAETDFTLARFAPQFAPCTIAGAADRCAVINEFGTVNPVYTAANFLSGAVGGFPNSGPTVSANDPTNPFAPGTKLGFLDEHVVGFETQLPKNFLFSVRYIDRRVKRIVEDGAIISPEGSAILTQNYFLGNISSTLDAATNPIPHTFAPGGAIPAACVNAAGEAPFVIDPVTDPRDDSVALGAVCYEPNANAGALIPDGVPDGFVDPVRNYRALEIEVNKRFSDNWQLLANYRLARLKGNYEGHLRSDNGQTDPGASSLFDFTPGEFNLLADQFAIGPLNSDRRHVVNIYASYAFGESGFGSNWLGGGIRGLNLGMGFRSESGLPINEFLAHPVYANAGEIPLGGRGKLGRTAWNNRLDLHVDYPWNFTEKVRLKFIADFFNVTNTRRIRRPQEFRELSLGVPNVDFLQPRFFYPPFSMRLGARLEF